MANNPIRDQNKPQDISTDGEALKPREEDGEKVKVVAKDERITRKPISESEVKKRLLTFRPSHKAMFIGLGVVIIILGINAAVLGYLLNQESANQKSIDAKGVSISPSTLSKLGVNDTSIGNTNEKLIVDPTAQFNSQLTVAGNVSIGGQLHLNSTLNATNANFSQLQAGNSSVNSININGAATASTLGVKSNFEVGGTATFQNAVTIAGLLSVNASAAISSNLSVGGELSASNIAVGNVVASGSIEVESHIITAGASPSVSRGAALGSYGSVSLSGNDIAGTIALGVGAGAPPQGGIAAYVVFHSPYSSPPVVVITPLGSYAPFFVGSTGTGRFTINSASGLSPGGYQINYMVEQ